MKLFLQLKHSDLTLGNNIVLKMRRRRRSLALLVDTNKARRSERARGCKGSLRTYITGWHWSLNSKNEFFFFNSQEFEGVLSLIMVGTG